MAASTGFPTHWLVVLPQEEGDVQQTIRRIAEHLRGSKKKLIAELSQFDVPSFPVGTLDSLLQLSDDLGRIDGYVEGVVRRIERQVADSHSTELPSLSARAEEQRAGGSGGSRGDHRPVLAAASPPDLQVDDRPVTAWLQRFRWQSSQWSPREALPALAHRLRDAAEAVDSDMRQYQSTFSEKRSEFTSFERRIGGNLLTAALEEVVSPETLRDAGVEVLDTEFLLTQFIVVPKSQEQYFLQAYEHLDRDSVPVGPDSDRESVRVSPVVPRSARRVTDDSDGYVLYAVVILRKFKDSFRAAAKAERMVVREYNYDPERSGSQAQRMAALEVEAQAALRDLREASVRHFGEAMSIWMHLKAVRAFAEAVLQYGLPPEYAYAIVRPKKDQHAKTRDVLQKAYSHLGGDEAADEEAETGAGAGLQLTNVGVPGLPFVNLGFDIHEKPTE